MQKQSSHLTQLRRIIALLLAIIEVFQIIKRYELICRRRDYHEPAKDDLDEFLSCGIDVKNTICIDCGCALQIVADDEDLDVYWIKEI